MRCRLRLRAFATRALAALVASAPPPALAQTLPAGFAFQSVVGGPFEGEPTGFAFLPDGRVLIVERETGNVRLAPAGTGTSVVVLTIPDVNSPNGERGLLGVAVDPGYPVRPYVYFYYSHTSWHLYLTMYTATGDLIDPAGTNLALASPFHILADGPDDFPVHHGGTIRFGKDGMLYASVGDNIAPCKAQDLDELHGKLLRLDVSAMPEPGGGPPLKQSIAPPDNPFDGPSANARLVYAFGLRNPFRFTVDPVSGDIFLGDVGLNNFEEIDRIPFGEGGENFGWPQREGFDVPNPPVNGCEPSGFAAREPIFAYEHGPPTSNAIIGGPLYRYDAFSPLSFGPEYEESYFWIDHGAGFLRRIVQTPSGWEEAPPALGQPSARNWAQGIYHISDMQLGPDGAIYLLKRYAPGSGPGSANPPGLYRIVPVPPTGAPVIALGGSRVRAAPNPARGGTRIVWDGAVSGARSIRIFDASGRLVRRLGEASSGALLWDARDVTGTPVPAGTYFFRAETADGGALRGKVSILR
jgi:glucose/arabinose dehydrogenase